MKKFYCQDGLNGFDYCKKQCEDCIENQPPPADKKLQELYRKMKK